MSFYGASSEKALPMSTPDRHDLNQPSTQELNAKSHSSSEQEHAHFLSKVPPVLAPFLTVFLFASMGVVSVRRLDYLIAKDDDPKKKRTEEWNTFRGAIVDRVNNINVVASLFITGAAVFVSTVSPNKDLADWGSNFCFYTFGGTIGVAILAVLTGCMITYIFMDLQTEDLRVSQDTHFKPRMPRR
ncbi:hypothetical protein FRB94_010203 [Tulasnella sp. JGI-2019a]|nr:hypothetical protein FRB94_010203 [Tulasnella sp. JGI-2019a]